MITYFKLLIYSCFFCILVCFFLGAVASLYIYITKGYFYIPLGQIERAIVFGCVAGSAITLYVLVVNVIDKFRTKKSPPTDPK
jgi:TRAP-type C4-dicarboxylate transport system permease small subunit